MASGPPALKLPALSAHTLIGQATVGGGIALVCG
jgi:hypothetical protein